MAVAQMGRDNSPGLLSYEGGSYASRRGALLQITRLIGDQDGARITQMPARITHPIRILPGPRQQLLHSIPGVTVLTNRNPSAKVRPAHQRPREEAVAGIPAD